MESAELDSELDGLLGEPEKRKTIAERALEQVPRILELAKDGWSKAAICKELGLPYTNVCKAEVQHKVLWEAFRAIEPLPGDVPGVVDVSRRVREDPASEANLKRIQEWSRNGVSWESQAALLFMTEEQFARYARNSPRVAEAIRLGKAEREATSAAALYKLALDPFHKDHIRAILKLGDREAAPEQDEKESLDPPETASAEQIFERLRPR